MSTVAGEIPRAYRILIGRVVRARYRHALPTECTVRVLDVHHDLDDGWVLTARDVDGPARRLWLVAEDWTFTLPTPSKQETPA